MNFIKGETEREINDLMYIIMERLGYKPREVGSVSGFRIANWRTAPSHDTKMYETLPNSLVEDIKNEQPKLLAKIKAETDWTNKEEVLARLEYIPMWYDNLSEELRSDQDIINAAFFNRNNHITNRYHAELNMINLPEASISKLPSSVFQSKENIIKLVENTVFMKGTVKFAVSGLNEKEGVDKRLQEVFKRADQNLLQDNAFLRELIKTDMNVVKFFPIEKRESKDMYRELFTDISLLSIFNHMPLKLWKDKSFVKEMTIKMGEMNTYGPESTLKHMKYSYKCAKAAEKSNKTKSKAPELSN